MLSIFFAKTCPACQEELLSHEKMLCIWCRHQLPTTNIHHRKSTEIIHLFYGRIPVINATALFYFKKKSSVQKLLHALKYKNQPDIGIALGHWLANELCTLPEYQHIDAIIPVPIHKRKLHKRGYNQVAGFAQTLAKTLNKPYYDQVLLKQKDTQSQVFKERMARLFSYTEVFKTKNTHLIQDKHLLLVDDLITTGATMEACAEQLLKTKGVKISLAAIAISQ